MTFPKSEGARNAYLGKFAQDFLMKSSEQMKQVYHDRGIAIPVLLSSVLHFLAENEGASIADVSKGLNLQHQHVAQRVQKLLALELVTKHEDINDRRRTEYHLTGKGKGEARRLIQCMKDTAQIYEELFAEIECDLIAGLRAAIGSIEARPLTQRFNQAFPADVAA